MIYDFISSYRPSYLPKTWVFSAQSAEPLRHRHAHDQEVLSGKKTPFPNEKNRMLFLFWRVYLCIYCIYVWKNYLLIMIHLTCSFACIYIDVLICLFVIYFFIYAFIYLFTVFIYSFIYVDVFMYFGLSKCWVLRKIPTKWFFRGHPRFPSTYPIRWPRGEGIPFPGFTSPIPSTMARKKTPSGI